MKYVIGVDVGGTNTDAVLMEGATVIACHKSATTDDVTTGIINAISRVLKVNDAVINDVGCVMIGTTHFINSVLQRSSELSRVAVLRLCGPSCELPPFSDFPADLREILYGHFERLDGGLEFDTSEITPLNADQIEKACEKLKSMNITDIVVSGVFSPINPQQEIKAGEIVNRIIPNANVTLSHELAFIGFLERENASILNASLRRLASKTVASFRDAILQKLGLKCPFFLTQNDGTLIDSATAEKYPVYTFASGATNSMRGAAFLSGKKDAIVVDIGGTSADFGVLVNGFPRIATTQFEVGGVRTCFQMPDLSSIALGGGSIIDVENAKLVPKSVGYKIATEGLVFGGKTTTATDIVVAQGKISVGDVTKVQHLTPTLISEIQAQIDNKLQEEIDKMKTNSTLVDVVLVGGGSILAPNSLNGVSEIVKPPYYDVANAVGAAISQVSGSIDTVISFTNNDERKQKIEDLQNKALEKAVSAGGKPGSASILHVNSCPVPYITGSERISIKAVAELNILSSTTSTSTSTSTSTAPDKAAEVVQENKITRDEAVGKLEEISPKLTPKISEENIEKIEVTIDKTTGEWLLSEFDIDLIADGCAILGAGGGGSTYLSCIYTKQILRETNRKIRVISPNMLADDDYVIAVGMMGAPTVLEEKLQTPKQIFDAFQANEQLIPKKARAVGILEIGGGNGVTPMLVAATRDLPIVDGDLIGRAFPELQMLAHVVKGGFPLTPVSLADEKGNTLILKDVSEMKWLEKLLRTATVTMGCTTAISMPPFTGAQVRDGYVLHSISRAWLLGRSIYLAKQRKLNPVDQIVQHEKGKLLFKGKITYVRRTTEAGFAKGTVTISGIDDFADDEISVDFQNEYIIAKNKKGETVASTPDIISILESTTGQNIFTPDVRFGQRVSVIGLVSPPVFQTEKALKIVGPTAFGYNINYEPLTKEGQFQSVFNM